ncbi:ABC transporter substrate-binding protein [Cohnella sp. LGH]|uniref:ABC transporter substrate-binding protein n=1 Tax=Cohnella sp. LGH TaxID=1619153 RepID=UPI001ADBFE95|nr:ABC transporter substrate-binding protein [Cohnella sp. LGH]QTH40154.1 ABC transporter substrate-binding protein [Cohnella sp. LGH]
MDRRRKWSIGIAALIIAAALGAAGCGNSNGNGDEGSVSSASTNGGQAGQSGQSGQSGQASQAASAESPKPDAELRKVKDAKGETEIPAKPQRIVDISGASEELALLGFKPIGTANQDSLKAGEMPAYLKEYVADAQIVGNYASGEANLEQIAALKPDLIVSSAMFDKVYEQLSKIAPVFVIEDDPLSFAGWRNRLVQLGAALGEEAKAAEWQKAYDDKAKAIGERIKAEAGEDNFAVVVAFPNNLSVFSGTGLGDMLYGDLGLPRSPGIPAEGWGETISLEGLTKIDADRIFLQFAEGTDAELEDSVVWRSLKAVRDGRVYKLPNEDYYDMTFSPIGKERLLDKIAELALAAP